MSEQIKRFITYYIRAFLLSAIVSGIGIMVVAGLLYKGTLGPESLHIAVYIIYFVAALIGGLVACQFGQNKRFLWGIIYGTLLFLLLFVISNMVNGDESTNVSYISLIICAIGGMVGGMLR